MAKRINLGWGEDGVNQSVWPPVENCSLLNHKLLLIYWRCYYLGFSSLAPFAANECSRQTNSEGSNMASLCLLFLPWVLLPVADQQPPRTSLEFPFYRQKGKNPMNAKQISDFMFPSRHTIRKSEHVTLVLITSSLTQSIYSRNVSTCSKSLTRYLTFFLFFAH